MTMNEYDKDDYKDHICKCGAKNVVILFHQMIGQSLENIKIKKVDEKEHLGVKDLL